MEVWKIVTDIFTLLAALAGGGGLFVALASRKKIRADSDYRDAQTAVRYNQLASEWISRLEAKVKSLEDEIVELKNTLSKYERHIVELLGQIKDRE